MFCQNCGTQNSSNGTFCTGCGAPFRASAPQSYGGTQQSKNDEADMIVRILSFCFPIVGIILYFVWKTEKPRSASQVCTSALISIGIGVAFYIIAFIIAIAAEGSK